MITPIYMMW